MNIDWINLTEHTSISSNEHNPIPLKEIVEPPPKGVTLPIFYPTPTFIGYRDGYVFTTGIYGTGYYIDKLVKI